MVLKRLLSYGKKDAFIRDNVTLFFATSCLSFASFLYHLLMGRFLGPVQYGDLGVLFSIFYIFVVVILAIQTTISNFVAKFEANDERDKINVLLRRALGEIVLVSLILVLLLLLISPWLASFLHVQMFHIWILAPLILFSLLVAVQRGVLQGLLRFKALGASLIVEGIAKVSFAVLVLLIGYGVAGAMFVLVVSYLIPFIVAFYILNQFLKKKKNKVNIKEVYAYAIPVIISIFLFTALYTADILLVKHYFDSETAGLYAALSFFGKIIFFATQSIAHVMFPKSAVNYSVKKTSKKLVNKTLLLVGAIGGIGVFVYFLIPKILITVMYGPEYIKLAEYLGPFGLIMLILSLCYVLILYNLSQKRYSQNYFLLGFFIIEIGAIFMFHESLTQIVFMLLAIVTGLYLMLLRYTYRNGC
jgi:O-antigen/teichoic acid export membrane protein